jgi:hypothetical protein
MSHVISKWQQMEALANEVYRKKNAATISDVRTLRQHYLFPVQVSKVQKGHDQMDLFRSMLNTFSRSNQQKQMHEAMLCTIVRQVYGDAVIEHELEICQYNGFETLDQEIVISAPRRFGKSWGVAMFCSVVLQVLKGCEISIFSSGARAAGAETGLSGIIRKMLIEHFRIPKEILWKDNQEHVFLKYAEDDIRKLNSYPGSVHTYVKTRKKGKYSHLKVPPSLSPHLPSFL